MIGFRRAPQNRIAALTRSVYTNSAVSMSLSLLDFPSEVVLTMIMVEVCWTLLPLVTRPLIAGMRAAPLTLSPPPPDPA